MSDVIVLPPSGALLLCQCVTQGAKNMTKKKMCASVLFKNNNNNKLKMVKAYFLFINVMFTGE